MIYIKYKYVKCQQSAIIDHKSSYGFSKISSSQSILEDIGAGKLEEPQIPLALALSYSLVGSSSTSSAAKWEVEASKLICYNSVSHVLIYPSL